jgi:hypothetical protein
MSILLVLQLPTERFQKMAEIPHTFAPRLRTALLIRCTADEAARIRAEAVREHRTISDYVSNIAIGAVEADSRLFSNRSHTPLNELVTKRSATAPSRRTAVLVRCAAAQAGRIREAARRRDISINAFVLLALKSAWSHKISSDRGAAADNP